jgi:diaminopimelate epimerase
VAELELAKYEALGNDFLILVDWERAGRFDAELAAALCDRHRGVGADGWLRLSAPDHGGAARIDLYNADGSWALTSGNGLRCAVLLADDLGIVGADQFVVETEVGDVAASLYRRADDAPVVRVGMGPVRVVPAAPSPVEGWRAFSVDVGNPHLVLLGAALGEADVASLGPALSSRVPGGQNVEFVVPGPGADELDLVTWERGAGQTLACGSGSAASAAAAHAAGLVGLVVTVHNPGGDLTVELANSGDGVVATLVGSARRVGRVVVDPQSLLGAKEGAT